MTQQQALEICKQLAPDAQIQLERRRCIGEERGHMNEFIVWDYSSRSAAILASSYKSWEHCIDILKAKNEELYEQDNSPVDPEAL